MADRTCWASVLKEQWQDITQQRHWPHKETSLKLVYKREKGKFCQIFRLTSFREYGNLWWANLKTRKI